MIEQTSVQISAQRERWQAERELRYARRNRIRHIDRLLDELEMLNIGTIPSATGPSRISPSGSRWTRSMTFRMG